MGDRSWPFLTSALTAALAHIAMSQRVHPWVVSPYRWRHEYVTDGGSGAPAYSSAIDGPGGFGDTPATTRRIGATAGAVAVADQVGWGVIGLDGSARGRS